MTALERLRERRARHRRRPLVVRVLMALAGFLAVAAGIVLLVLPGPGLPLLALGLGLLALEFRWAEAPLARALRASVRAARPRPARLQLSFVGALAEAGEAPEDGPEDEADRDGGERDPGPLPRAQSHAG